MILCQDILEFENASDISKIDFAIIALGTGCIDWDMWNRQIATNDLFHRKELWRQIT